MEVLWFVRKCISLLPELNVKCIDFGTGSGSWTVTATWLMNRTYMYVNEIVAGWMIRAVLLVRALFVSWRNALPACSSTKDSSEKHRETWKPSPRNPFATEILPRFTFSYLPLDLTRPRGSCCSSDLATNRRLLGERKEEARWSPSRARIAKGIFGSCTRSTSIYLESRAIMDYPRRGFRITRAEGRVSLLFFPWAGTDLDFRTPRDLLVDHVVADNLEMVG